MASVVLVGGHESAHGRDLLGLVPGAVAVRAGRELGAAVRAVLRESSGPVVVVPMTLGRDPALVAEAARALRWQGDDADTRRLALTEPFGTPDHLVGWLRAAATGAAARWPGDRGALLVTAAASGPFDEADLFRVARLVRQHGPHPWVEVALAGGDPDVTEGLRRCAVLGAGRVTVVPAAFGPAPTADAPPGVPVHDGGPLLSTAAVQAVVTARVTAALDHLVLGHTGIEAALHAEHGHGYAHSHGAEPAHSHH